MKISIVVILLIITSACTAQQLLSYDDFTLSSGLTYKDGNRQSPYSALRKDYDIRIVADKNITANN